MKSGHEGVVCTWFSFSMISCWHWTLTSVFAVTATPSPALHTASCHFELITSQHLVKKISSTETRRSLCFALRPHLSWPASISAHHEDSETLQGTATWPPSTLEFLSITGAHWLSQETEHGKGQHGPSEILRRPTLCSYSSPYLSLGKLPSSSSDLWKFSSFAFSASLSNLVFCVSGWFFPLSWMPSILAVPNLLNFSIVSSQF